RIPAIIGEMLVEKDCASVRPYTEPRLGGSVGPGRGRQHRQHGGGAEKKRSQARSHAAPSVRRRGRRNRPSCGKNVTLGAERRRDDDRLHVVFHFFDVIGKVNEEKNISRG